jgi:hypothetical protein
MKYYHFQNILFARVSHFDSLNCKIKITIFGTETHLKFTQVLSILKAVYV